MRQTIHLLAVPVRASATCFALILLGFWLAGFVPRGWEGNWTAHVVRDQAHMVDRFFPFDAAWYQRIADGGYGWDPSRPRVKQDIAFFPLWPMVLRCVAWCVPSAAAARWVVVGVAASTAFGSVWAVHRLACETLPLRAAVTATWLYALCPAGCFLLLSYPTGLMTLLAALAVLAVLRRRFWAAALCAGVMTAGGPLGLGTAMMVFVTAATDALALSPIRVARLAALGVVSIAGLLGFTLYQACAFGDPLVFMKAQDAWGAPMSWLGRVPRTMIQLAILPDFGAGFAHAVHSFHARTLVAFEASCETALNCVAEGVALLMLPVCLFLLPRALFLQGALTLVLFIWFHASFWLGHATLRLTYCALTTFMGLGVLLDKKPELTVWAIVISGTILTCFSFLLASGFHIV